MIGWLLRRLGFLVSLVNIRVFCLQNPVPGYKQIFNFELPVFDHMNPYVHFDIDLTVRVIKVFVYVG